MAVGEAVLTEGAARLAAARACIGALRRREEPVDARLRPHAEWLYGPHRANVERPAER